MESITNEKAKNFSTTEANDTKDLCQNEAPWSIFLAEKIIELKPKKILEFGCNTERHLTAIQKRDKNIQLCGIRVNGDDISFGKNESGLDLQSADENFLHNQEDNSYDIIFSISVLDHCPKPAPIIEQMVRVAKHCVLLVEPYLDTSMKKTQDIHPNDENAVKTTPSSYSWDYENLSSKFPVTFSKTHYPLDDTNIEQYSFFFLTKNQSSDSLLLARDKISQVYLGVTGAPATQDKARERINWLAKETTGATVLDIGCSEGILPILLGREGYKVLGIDVNSEALEFAENLLEKEDQTVRNIVQFRQKNILYAEGFEEKFDTVIIAEVIEHLFHPHKAVDNSVQRLKQDGRILLTTPFGYFPDPDHHQTFSLTDVVDIVEQYCTIEHISVVDGYIRVIGKKQTVSNDNKNTSREKILSIVENAAIEVQRALRSNYNLIIEQNKNWITKLKNKNQELHSQSNTLNTKTNNLNTKTKELNIKNQNMIKKNNELSTKNNELSTKTNEQNTKSRELNLKIQELKNNNKKLKFSNKALTQSNNKFNRKNNQLSRNVKAIKGTEAWKIGYVTVKALKEPGKNTLLWIPRLIKIAFDLRPQDNKTKRISQPIPAPSKKKPTVAPHASKEEIAAEVPNINVAPKLKNVRVAAILDDFSLDCFKYECDLLLVTPENWMQEIINYKPDFLFVESAWKGNGGVWSTQLTNALSTPSAQFVSLVLWCRNQGIKTVFWNKEDPPNYDKFINSAQLFEFVLTTDENCISQYIRDTGHDKIKALPFAAQPAIHNPIIDDSGRDNNVAFAGSWYANKHQDRKTDMENILLPALDFDLQIFDRNYNFTKSDYYKFPDIYQGAIKGSLSYSDMVIAYKNFKLFLNVNSVQNSPTMFSRRVFELMACNTPVISGYSTGIAAMLGDLVPMVRSQEETHEHLEHLLGHDDIRERYAHQGMRKVMKEHTYTNRFATILEFIGIPIPKLLEKKISIVTCTNRPKMLDKILDNYTRQLYSNKEFILVLNNDSFNKTDVEQVIQKRCIAPATIIQIPEEQSLGECLNAAIDASTGEYWTKLDDDNYYAEHFISDLLLPFEYTDAFIVGKCSYYAYLEGVNILAIRFAGHEHKYVNFLSGSAMIVKREVFAKVRFPEKSVGEDTKFLNDCTDAGYKMYSADRFNYVCTRREETSGHTWKIEQDEYLKKCKVVTTTDDYRKITDVATDSFYNYRSSSQAILDDRETKYNIVSLPDLILNSDILKIQKLYSDTYFDEKQDHIGLYTRDDWARIAFCYDHISKSGDIVDVGVGAGQFINLLALSGHFSKVNGVDITRHSKFIQFTDNLEIMIASIASDTIDCNKYDTVVCMEVLEHLEKKDFLSALNILRSMCRKKLIISIPFKEPEPLPSYHKLRFSDDDINKYFPLAEKYLLTRGKGVAWMMMIETYDGQIKAALD